MSDALARALRWGKEQFSLDTPQQDLLSPETAGDMALGMIPGVGQAMAVRDMARGVKAEDPTQVALAAAGLIPFGKLAGSLKNQIIAGKLAKNAPTEEIAAGEAALKAGRNPDSVWKDLGVFQGTENHAPTKWEIPDQKAQFQKGKGWTADDLSEGYSGRLGDMLQHDQLYAAYPHLADVQVLSHVAPTNLAEGGYHAGRKGQPAFIEATGKDRDELMKVILHEIQHGVQAHEGFDPGANYNTIKDAMLQGTKVSPKAAEIAAFNKYRGNMGEVESRGVELRHGQSPEYNRSVSPVRDYDVPLSKMQSADELKNLVIKLRNMAPSD
jgi:hypothetical protein